MTRSYRWLAPMGMLLLSAYLQVGCAIKDPRSFQYDLGDVAKLPGGPLAQYSLGVELLEDERPQEVRAREGGFLEPAVVEREGEDWYFNSDNYYSLKPITWGMTRGIVVHIAAAGLFKSVAVASEAPASDLILEGVLEKFDCYLDREEGKQALVAQAGLIGLAIQASDKSPYETHVVLSGLKLSRRSDGVVLWAGQVEVADTGEAPISALTDAVYRRANAALKQAVNQLLDELSRVDPAVASSGAAPPSAKPGSVAEATQP